MNAEQAKALDEYNRILDAMGEIFPWVEEAETLQALSRIARRNRLKQAEDEGRLGTPDMRFLAMSPSHREKELESAKEECARWSRMLTIARRHAESLNAISVDNVQPMSQKALLSYEVLNNDRFRSRAGQRRKRNA